MALTITEAMLLLSPARPFAAALSVPSAIDEPSVPSSLPGDQFTVGAKGFTVTASLAVATPLVLWVAVKVSVKFASLAGVMLRPDRFQASTSVELWPAVAVKLWPWPSLSVAPSGMAPTSSDFMLAMFLLNEIVPSAIAWPSVPVSLFGDQFAVNDGMGPLETWSFWECRSFVVIQICFVT